MNGYRTIGHEASAQIVVKKSRFLATAWPVASVDMAKERIAAVRKGQQDASHHCYAYVIGENRQHVKYFDDKEPKGTAGLPILDVIQKKQLTQVLVVVTRYFGGVLLGASGLTRAYGSACAAVLREADLCIMVFTDEVTVRCPYTVYDKLSRFLKDQNVVVKDSVFEIGVTISLLSRVEHTEELLLAIADVCGGNAACGVHGQTMTKWPLDTAEV